jgi:DNA-binding GntR family transcriptional regulator
MTELLKSKPSNESLSVKAFAELRSMILNNQLKIGIYYLERELVELLNISRTPLKEALLRLEHEGLIKIQPRHGIRVLPISVEDMEEIYQVITCLECEAILSLANRTLSVDDLALLEACSQSMVQALEKDDLTAWAEADEKFHTLILDLCGNKRLRETVMMFWGQAHRARYFTLSFREKPKDSTNDHHRVIQAIKKGDADTAVSIHRQHRVKGGRILIDILKKFPIAGN